MKTTIDLPEDLLHRAKVHAAQRRITLKQLISTGLERVMNSEVESSEQEAALTRLRKGLHLGGQAFSREQAHERR